MNYTELKTELKQAIATAAKTTRSAIGLYTSLSAAQSASFRGPKPQRVMMTEYGYYAVVSPAIAARLEALGYEYA